MKDYESFNFACLMENIMSPSNAKKFHRINPQLVEAFFNIVCAYVTNCFKAEKACNVSLCLSLINKVNVFYIKIS